ncbi:helix-turn-helix domain-containing protein [Streptomyces albireticuli]|uniref:Transcriptional regulator n=1 Tax=Streptomyces albireticuli TaxID=1940 RepID=A0A2A2CYR5_9ACTN|nr:helix-turn-helix domain-containing protein [Streptomyces albireticuli]MCD9145866.1 helix-turn-helix domain-containing protein [Streptomyces albireticuli]MCD9166147.1 helix-turn-helix domain-containing protein [Streptomyces albireticuli]MCD9189649.1 helix-turn-helix domain-containing protein [Streptomyces albireticuli]PAU45358.1 transcriptional regulator [Streptomyces albireticuli]
MSDFDAIDSLLAGVGPEAELPSPQVRQELRERARLSKAQVARALGVSPSTVAAWEGGRDPVGEVRTKYRYLLDGLATKFTTDTAPVTPSPAEPAAAQAPNAADAPPASPAVPEEGGEGDEVEALAVPEPCVLCGQPAGTRVAGFAQHLDPADCQTTAAVPPAQPATTPVQPGTAHTGKPTSTARTSRTPRPSERSQGPARRAFQEPSGPVDLIGQAVQAALAEHHGDVEAATAALVKRAIPDAMRLLDETRKGARYDVIAHPWIPDILKKQTSRGADQIWEARPKWTRRELPPGKHEVTALDINGAYLSALKTHLPLGQLEHSAGLPHDRRRAGVHLITPPVWEHEAVLPNPIGQRDEPGPLWVTEPTLRLLLRLSGPKYGLCAPPEVHESYTSGATENLLEKFRIALKDARDEAIEQGDEVTLEYVKAMYSKFVSTMGESNYNRELYRPDWMHIIRSQAFANLWLKALKAHDEGLAVVRAMGTDELHVIGDWHRVFPEGRGVTEVKVKDTYTAGTDTDDTTGEERE